MEQIRLKELEEAKEEKECVQESEDHPLLNDLVLDRILYYVDAEAEDSYQTLKNMREVCKAWTDHVTPKMMIRSKIVTFTSGPQGYRIWGTKNQKYLDSLMTLTKKTSLEIIQPPNNSPNSNYETQRKHILMTQTQLWNSQTNWIRLNGHKFTSLTISGEFHENVFNSLLHEWIPNLEELKMRTVGFSKEANVVDHGSSSSDFKSLQNLKHLTIEINVDFVQVGVADAIEAAFNVLAQAKNLKSLTLNPKTEDGNILSCFFNKILSQDKGILNHLTNLNLMIYFKNGSVPLPPILTQVKLTNLKELHISTHYHDTLNPLLETHGQKLEKLFVQVSNCFIPRNVIFNIPQLPNLKEFTCLFGCIYFENCSYNIRLAFNAESVISFMPRLKSWKIQDDGKRDYSNNFRLICATGECTHVMGLFETSDGKPLPAHTHLEQLNLFCSFDKPGLVRKMADAFGNIRVLTIWINSKILNLFFAELTTLQKLKRLVIQLNKSLLDLPIAINSNMANFKNLKELTFEKCHRLSISYECCVAELYEAHFGFAKCETLEILSFSNLKMDRIQLELLRKELFTSKPKLAVNYHYYGCLNFE